MVKSFSILKLFLFILIIFISIQISHAQPAHDYTIKSCYDGANANQVCSVAGDCPGGVCLDPVVAWWSLDEPNGIRSAGGSCGSACDLNDNNGVGQDTTNKMQGSASALFDSSNKEYLSCSDSVCTDLSLSGSFTLGCWIRPVSLSDMSIIDKYVGFGGIGVENQQSGFRLDWSDFLKVIGMYIGNGTSTRSVNDNNKDSIPINEFHHGIAVFDNINEKMIIYTDGIKGSLSGTVNGFNRIEDNNVDFKISSNFDSFDGQLDECFVHNKAFTSNQVCEICRFGLDGQESDRAELCYNCEFGNPSETDTEPPIRYNPSPSGTLPAGTDQVVLSIITNEAATCHYSNTPGISYMWMTESFTYPNSFSHSKLIWGLGDGTYNYYVKCSDTDGNENTDDFIISFIIGNPSSSTCGNGIREEDEYCDGTDYGGKNCISIGQGFVGGNLSCNADCTEDVSGCISNICGNYFVEGSEQCDGPNLAGETCISKGFIGGTLSCNSNCGFDFSGCVSSPSQTCGNNVKEGTEQCDGTDLSGETCISKGFDGGNLSCFSYCVFDTSSCTNNPSQSCGNNIIEGSEQCDGTDLGGESCISKGFDGGILKCSLYCSLFDTSKCTTTPTCGDGKCEYGESYDTCPEDCSCIDSDDDGSNNGLNYFEKGTVQSDNGIFEDNCQSNKRLQENYCNGNVKQSNTVYCPGEYVCKNGACIEESLCGNNIRESTEQCDGTDLSGESCISKGFINGSLYCSSNCVFDFSYCISSPAIKITTKYYNGATTDFSTVNVTNIQEMSIEKVGFGKIKFNEPVKLSRDINLDLYSNIAFNKITIDSVNLPELNISATLTLTGLNFTNPRILRDGSPCPDNICKIISYSDGILVFNVTGFSEYSAGENPVSCTDNDSDGYGNNCALGSDCNDNNAGINPRATEICEDGIDQDCSGEDSACPFSDDESPPSVICTNGQTQSCGSDTGVCKTGTRTCINNQWGDCVGDIKPTTDICDGLDNNCDGEVDENCNINTTCNNGIQDSNEEGVDCGDVCSKICQQDSILIIIVILILAVVGLLFYRKIYIIKTEVV